MRSPPPPPPSLLFSLLPSTHHNEARTFFVISFLFSTHPFRWFACASFICLFAHRLGVFDSIFFIYLLGLASCNAPGFHFSRLGFDAYMNCIVDVDGKVWGCKIYAEKLLRRLNGSNGTKSGVNKTYRTNLSWRQRRRRWWWWWKKESERTNEQKTKSTHKVKYYTKDYTLAYSMRRPNKNTGHRNPCVLRSNVKRFLMHSPRYLAGIQLPGALVSLSLTLSDCHTLIWIC